MTRLLRNAVASRLIVTCALALAALLAGQERAAADDADLRPLQLEVYINDAPTNRIGAFAQLANQQIAASRGELADVGVKAPGDGRAGDTISGGLPWTRPIRLGGLQMQRNFALRPDLVTLPLPSYSGSAAVPSTVDVYVNNVRALSQPVTPGPYQISNLPLLSGGGTARVVMQDAAGHQIEASLPYFTSPTLLRQGLTDYTLEAGYPRLNFATQSN